VTSFPHLSLPQAFRSRSEYPQDFSKRSSHLTKNLVDDDHVVQGPFRGKEAKEAATSPSKQIVDIHIRSYTMDPSLYLPLEATMLTRAVMVDIFFREIRSRGSYRIPRRGAVIFVAAPHANQVRLLHKRLLNLVY
jgi:hypothetical protein